MAPTPTSAEQRSLARARRSARHLEALAGLLGFFTLVVFVVTAAAELTGRPAGALALTLLVMVLALAGTVWAARRARATAGPPRGWR